MKKTGKGTYLEYFNDAISPRLKEIDISLKCGEEVAAEKVSELLNLPLSEIERILKKSPKRLKRKDIIYIMEKGSSEICELYKREVELGSPYLYSVSDVAYIYGLDCERLGNVCRNFGIAEITWQTLPAIFSCMPAVSED